MTSTVAHLSSASPNSDRSQLSSASSSSAQHPPEQTTTDDATHHQHVPRHRPDVVEHEKNSAGPTFDHIISTNERNSSLAQTTTGDGKLSTGEECLSPPFSPSSTTTSSLSNQIKTATDVQSNSGDVPSLNHNISRGATSAAFHSVSSDVNSPTRHFIASSFDQQSRIHDNADSLPHPPLASSVFSRHEHANDKYLEDRSQVNISVNDPQTSKNQTSVSSDSPVHTANARRTGSFVTRRVEPKEAHRFLLFLLLL